MGIDENLQNTLSFYSVDCPQSYYISSGRPIVKFPKKSFRMDYYTLCICTSGEIHIEIDNEKYNANSNTFLISAPSTIVKFLKSSDDFKMKLLFFDKNFLIKNISTPFIIEKMELFNKGSYSIVKTTEEKCLLLERLLDYLKEKSERQGKFTDEIVRTIIFNILLETGEIIETQKEDLCEKDEGKKDLFLKFSKLVRENIKEQKSVAYYAERLFVSSKYLIEIIKKASGKTPHQVIDEMLLKEAFAMLGNSDFTISEIAFRLQFNSISAFGRFFKKHTLISPSQYRIKENIQS